MAMVVIVHHIKSLYLKNNSAVIGLCGHCGCGHAHSHNGFTQDDSAGFAVVASILKQTMPLDTAISDITSSSDGNITIVLNSGGVGHAVSAAGFTPFEQKLLKRRWAWMLLCPRHWG